MSMFLRCVIAIFFSSLWLVVSLTSVSGGGQEAGAGFIMLNLSFQGDNDATRLVATFNADPRQKLMRLGNPPRLVIDLPQTRFAVPADKLEPHGLVENVRYGLDGAGGARIVLGIRAPFRIGKMDTEALHDDIWQMTIELEKIDNQSFVAELMSGHMERGGDKQISLEKEADNNDSQTKPFSVMIDAGHGGFDSGAEGVGGVLEKDVTLAFAHALRDVLQQKARADSMDMAIYLTRERDEFLRLSQRVQQARLHQADLFISIHADSIHVPNLRGATVYTLSDKASDALAKSIAENENKAEFIGDLPPDEAPEVTDILLDLTRRETDAFSRRFADTLIVSLHQGNIKLIRDPHRYAGFMVLRAPDIPSILLELGYLSNKEDEKLIADPAWRQNMAQLIATSVLEFARIHPAVRR